MFKKSLLIAGFAGMLAFSGANAGTLDDVKSKGFILASIRQRNS